MVRATKLVSPTPGDPPSGPPLRRRLSAPDSVDLTASSLEKPTIATLGDAHETTTRTHRSVTTIAPLLAQMEALRATRGSPGEETAVPTVASLEKAPLEGGDDEEGSFEDPVKKSVLARVAYWMGLPIFVANRVAVPLLDERYDWRLVLVQPTLAICWILFSFGQIGARLSIGSAKVPVVAFAIPLGMLLSLAFYRRMARDPDQPQFYLFFLLLSMITAVSTIYLVSLELVAILTTLGIALSIPQEFVGLSVLAWGNGVADTVSDVTVAQMGVPGMAIGAIFGGPVMNIVLGIGLSYTFVRFHTMFLFSAVL